MKIESYYSRNSSIVQDCEGVNPNPNPTFKQFSDRVERVLMHKYDVFMRPITFPMNFVCNGFEWYPPKKVGPISVQ